MIPGALNCLPTQGGGGKKLHPLLSALRHDCLHVWQAGDQRTTRVHGNREDAAIGSDMSQVLYTFKVDRSVFKLAVEAMRIRSLETGLFETVSSTAMKGLENFVICDHPGELIAMAREADLPGEHRVTFRIQLHQKDLFQRARQLAAHDDASLAPVRLTFITALLAAFAGTFTDPS